MAAEDTLITHVTQARTDEAALAIVRKYKPTAVLAAAGLLYVEADGHGIAWVRAAVVREARS